ncbi:uncharacterized protein LOC135468570 isoform X2 [Liolophura sinensis]|uniref:uncharacterized protein LOC135468570 isoform X2 n=1 Tax=Liolophura sinensis TaxID=3198878 RepID=UPI003159481E
MLAGVRPAGVISRRVHGQPSQRFTGGPNYLPGTLRGTDGEIHTSTASTLHVSSTELDAHGVSQYSGHQKTQNIPDHHSTAVHLNQARPRTAPTLYTSGPAPQEHPPVAKNNAWSSSHKPSMQNGGRTAVPRMSNTVEDRLKTLLSNSPSGTGNKVTKNPYEDGELLKPPTPVPRQTTLPSDHADNTAIIEEDSHLQHPVSKHLSEVQRHSVNSTVSSSGYVPSIPSDRWSSSYGETVFERTFPPDHLPSHSPSLMTALPGRGHENYAYQPDNHQQISSGSSQEQRQTGGSSDLRAAWNRLYGQEGKTVLKPPVPLYRPQQNITNAVKKGPPPPPPIRNESVQREEEPRVSKAITQPRNSTLLPPTHSSVSVSPAVRLEERKLANVPIHVSRPDNFLYPDAAGYPHDAHGNVGTGRNSNKTENSENTSRTVIGVSQGRPVTTVNHVTSTFPPGTPGVIERSGSYEELGIVSEKKKNPSTKPSRDPGFVSRLSSQVRHANEFPSSYIPSSSDYADIDGLEDTPLAAHDSIFDRNSEESSGSVTPPLPPLSPSNSPPTSVPSSPNPEPKFPRSLSADMLSTPKAPDLLASTKQAPASAKNRKMTSSELNWRKYSPRENSSKHRNQKRSKNQYGISLNGVKDSDEESFPFDIHNTTLTVEQSPRTSQDTARASSNQIRDMQRKLDGLEALYSEVLKRVEPSRGLGVRERRHSIGSSDTSSFRRVGPFRHSSSHKPRIKDLKTINKRFQKLESHVVTLARSVAHLSSEMKSQNALLVEMDRLRQEVKDLREVALSNHKKGQGHVPDFDRFRGWVPALTNPKRVNKLTKFFGQEPPLLEIFLRRLGYEKFTQNFKVEHIGMIELPYMTEERLKTIGIPMGPRLRILQEAQLCFRQENFDIYIV